MRILLFSLNSRYIHVAPAPYSLRAGVFAYAREHHDVTVIDRTVNDDREALLALLRDTPADLYAFPTYIWNVSLVEWLVPRVKEAHPDAYIVLGGPEVSYDVPHFLSRLPQVDFILSGEGERPFALLADTLAKGGDPSGVVGCSFPKKDGALHVSPPYIDTDTPPSPLSAGYAEALEGRIAYIEASRGCPFSCSFCLSGRTGGVRYFDLDGVKKDILALVKGGSKTVKFVDRTFNSNIKRAREIFSFLLAERGKAIPSDVCFHFEMAGELLDEETLALLETVPKGYFQTEIGLQSFSKETLRAIHRSDRTDGLCENVRRLLARGNIHTHLDLIAGLPKEGLASFDHSFNSAFALRPHMLQVGFLKLLRGAPLRENTRAFPCSFAETPPYTVLSTPDLSEEELAVIRLVETGCDRLYNSRRYLKTVERVLAQGTLSPFRLFALAGEALEKLPDGYTLNDEVAMVFEAFRSYISADALLDAMKEDFVRSNSSCRIPPVLRDESRAYTDRLREINACYPPRKGVRRSVVLLSTGEALLTEYGEKDPVTHLYDTLRITQKTPL